MTFRFLAVPATGINASGIEEEANLTYVSDLSVTGVLLNGTAYKLLDLSGAFWSPAFTPSAAALAPDAFTASMVYLEDAPSAGGNTLDIVFTGLPNDNGAPLLPIEYAVDSGSGFGAWLETAAIAGRRTITVLAGTPAQVKVRAKNAIGPSAEYVIPGFVTPTYSIIGGTAAPKLYDFALLPNGDAGKAYLILPDRGFSDGAVSRAQYRTQVLSTEVDMRVLGDPPDLTDGWSAWIEAPTTPGVTEVDVPSVPCAVQMRVQRSGFWSRASLFHRIGLHYFGYDDSVITQPGAVAETIPATVKFGRLGVYGEQKQRVPDAVTAITAGNASGHFEIVTVGTRKYLQLSVAGVASATGAYTLTLNGGVGTVNVSVLANTMVVASGWHHATGTVEDRLLASVAEVQAFHTRNGVTAGSMSGKTLLFRPGFYDMKKLTTNQVVNHHMFDNASAMVTIGPADPTQKPRLTKMTVNTPTGGTGHRLLTIEELHFFELYITHTPTLTLGSVSTMLEVNSSDDTSQHVVRNNLFETDGLESRYGNNIRGLGPVMRISAMQMRECTGVEVYGNTAIYCNYPLRSQGVWGVYHHNLTTHCEADYVNTFANPNRASKLEYRFNRHREHIGHQDDAHTDANHMWIDGTHEGCRHWGNIWATFYEGRACVGSLKAQITSSTVNPVVDLGTFNVNGEVQYEQVLNILTRGGVITLHPPGSSAARKPNTNSRAYPGYTFAGINASEDVIEVVGQGIALTIYPRKTFIVHDTSGEWVEDIVSAGHQGAPYQNDGKQTYDGFWFHHNIKMGVLSPTDALFSGISDQLASLPVSFTSVASQGIYNHNNTTLVPLLSAPRDDLDANGIINAADGAGTDAAPQNRYYAGLRAVSANAYVGEPTDICDFKNIVGSAPDALGFVDVWGNGYNGRIDQDTLAKRLVNFANGTGAEDFTTVVQTFAGVIEQARVKADSPFHLRGAGTIGPLNTSPGYLNPETETINPYPTLVPTFVTPSQNGNQPMGEPFVLFFDWPVRRGPGAITIQTAAGVPIATTVTVEGRKVTVTGPWVSGTTYDVVVAADAIRHYAESTNDWVGCAEGILRFTPSSAAYKNIMARIDGGNPATSVEHQFDGNYFAVSSTQRWDMLRYIDPAAFMPTSGDAVWSVQVEKGVGSARMRLYTVIATAISDTSVIIDRSTGAITSAPAGGTLDVTYGVIDAGPAWRIWQRRPATAGITRYFMEAVGAFNWRRPMLTDANAPNAPFVSPISPFNPSAGAIAPNIGAISNQSLTQNTGTTAVNVGAVTSGSNLSYSLPTTVTGVTINASTGVISINTGTTGALSGQSIVVRATDTVSGLFDEESFTVTVAAAVAVFSNTSTAYLSDPNGYGANTGKLTIEWEVKPNATSGYLGQGSGLMFDLSIQSNGSVRAGAITDSASLNVNTTTSTATGLVGTTAMHLIRYAIDLPNRNAVLMIDGIERLNLILAANSGSFNTGRLIRLLATSAGGSNLLCDVKRIRIWKEVAAVLGDVPVSDPFKTFVPPAATVNADPWKQGAGLFL